MRIESRSASPSTSGTAAETTVSEPNYYQNDLITKAHEPHENCPNTLDCLPDTNGRPQHTLPVILRCAILGSPKKRLTIREIYAAMERKYSYYKTAGPAWKVRRSLISLRYNSLIFLVHVLFAAIRSTPPILESPIRKRT